MAKYLEVKNYLSQNQFTWLITGVAGFIGSNLMLALLKLNQRVVGLDNFSTGYQRNIDEVLSIVPQEYRNNFIFYKSDICSQKDCSAAVAGTDYVLHQAALGSVPRSIEEPLATHDTNATGFVNMLIAAKNHKVKRFVYASSSAVYGDSANSPKVENIIGSPLSPYAASKHANEIYAKSFAACFGIETVGLRYFNVFGARQDPNGAYAAVIPLWIKALLNKDVVFINGDGETTRDFCYIENVVQANLLAATAQDKDYLNTVYNIAVGDKTSLNELCSMMCSILKISNRSHIEHRGFRAGDIRHSLANVNKAVQLLGYQPEYRIYEGLQEAMNWYINFFK